MAAKYRSIVPWKSRWSWPRLVNTATAKRVASARCCSRACDDTSMATALAAFVAEARPARACSSGASGVVCTPVSVPSTPHGKPACSKIDASRCVVVVLPVVPVTPTTVMAADGWPWKAAAMRRHGGAGVVHHDLGHGDVERVARPAARWRRPRRRPARSRGRRRARPAGSRTGRRRAPTASRATTPRTITDEGPTRLTHPDLGCVSQQFVEQDSAPAHQPEPFGGGGQAPPFGDGGICSCCSASWAMPLNTGAAVLPPKWAGPAVSPGGSMMVTRIVILGFSAGRKPANEAL